jgi:hypothetical protein
MINENNMISFWARNKKRLNLCTQIFIFVNNLGILFISFHFFFSFGHNILGVFKNQQKNNMKDKQKKII